MICSSFVFRFWKGSEWEEEEEEVNLVHLLFFLTSDSFFFFFEGGVVIIFWKVGCCVMYCLADDVLDYFI